jgi:hypothetical protein
MQILRYTTVARYLFFLKLLYHIFLLQIFFICEYKMTPYFFNENKGKKSLSFNWMNMQSTSLGSVPSVWNGPCIQ